MGKINKQSNQTDIKYKPNNVFVISITMTICIIAYSLTAIFVVLLHQSNFNIRDFIVNSKGVNLFCFTLGFLAFGLYDFKSRQQFWYGIFEVAFGYYSIAMVGSRLQKTILIGGVDPFSIIGGLSAVYLIVRGLSNISEGYSKPFRWKNIVMKYSQ